MIFSKFKITKEPHVRVKVDGKTKTISLLERINKPELSGEPEKNRTISQEQFFMSLAKVSAKKQGRHERHPEHTVSSCDDQHYIYNWHIVARCLYSVSRR